MTTPPPGFGSWPPGGSSSGSHGHGHPAPVLNGPVLENDSEPWWIGTAVVAVIGLVVVSFLFGPAVAKPYVVGIIIAGIVASILVGRRMPVILARLAAFVITALLLLLLWHSGLPYVVMQALSPFGQSAQDEGGTVGTSVTMFWMLLLAACFVTTVIFYWTRRAYLIVLAGFLLPLAAIPFMGMIAQELAKVRI